MLTVFVSILFSCKTDTKEFSTFSESDFSKTIELDGSVLKVDQVLMHPANIHVYGNFLFLKHIGTAYIYEIYDLNTNKKINECISVGQGPGEMIAPQIIDIKNNRIWIYDSHKTSIFEYKLEDFISSHNPEINKTLKLNAIYLQVCISGNTLITSSLNNPGNRFDFFNLDGELLYSNGKYPPNDLSLSDMATKRFYDFNYAITSDSKIFTAHFYTDIIEIYDIEGNLIRRCQGPDQRQPKLKERSIRGGGTVYVPLRDEAYQCYSHNYPVSAKDEIFVLYFGDLYLNYLDSECDRILVFDTKGTPQRIYKLKTPIASFTVDSDKRIIYGITDKPEKEEDEFNIIKYEY
jgi:hypothetical protein